MTVIIGYSQTEESIDVSIHGSDTITTKLISRNIETKKYCKISKTTGKKISSESKGFIPEYKKIYETSLFVYREEKPTEFSGSKKLRRKKSVQVQLHSKRTEIATPSLKVSKEKITKKESPSKLPSHKPSLTQRTASTAGRKVIPSNLSLTLYEQVPEEFLKHQELNDYHTMDIGDIIFTLDELQRQYEDVLLGYRVPTTCMLGNYWILLIFASSGRLHSRLPCCLFSRLFTSLSDVVFVFMDEATSGKRASTIPGHHPQQKKSSLLSRMPEPSTPKNQTVPPQPHPSKTTGKQDEAELKLSKRSSETRRLSSGIISDSVGLQESQIKIHDSKSKSPSLKSTPSLSKLPDRRDSSLKKSPDRSDSSLKKSPDRRDSSLKKRLSSTLHSAASTIKNAYEVILKLQEDYISPEELQTILPSVGVTLSDEDFQRIVPELTQTESGMVNLDDFITAVSKEHNFPDYDALKNAIEGISKIQDEYVEYEDLDTCLQNFGVYLPKSERQRIKELIQVDDTKQVNIKKFIDAMLKNTHPFSEDIFLPAAIENLQNFCGDQMDVAQLWKTLSSLDSSLKEKEFLDAVKLATVDGDKVQLEDFSKVVKDMHDSVRLKELQEIVSALDSLEGEKIPGKNVDDFLKSLGITSFKDELEEILQSEIVSDDNMLSVKDCMEALKDTSKFSNFTALKEAIEMLDSVKGSYWSDKERFLEGLEDLEGLKKEVLSSNLVLPTVSEIKEVAGILSQVEDGKITIPDLERALKYLNLNISEEDFKEVLKHCDISDEMYVDLKDFLVKLRDIPSFKDSIVTQLLLATPQVLEKDLINVSDLKKLLTNNELHSAKAILTEVLKHVPEDEEGKITIEEFVSTLSDILRTLKSEREKEILHNTNFDLNNVNVTSEIKQSLDALGIHITGSDIQRAMENMASSGEVITLKDIIKELANSDVFSECQRIEDIHRIIDVIGDGKMDVKDFLSALNNFTRPLEEEGQSDVSQSPEMNEKEAILRNTINYLTGVSAMTRFKSLLKGVQTFDNIRGNKMPVDELVSNLMSTGMPISQSTMQELLRQASVDENEEVSLKQILENLATRNPDPVLEDIENALNSVKLMTSDKIQVANLKDALKDLNIHLSPEELQQVEEALNVDENGEVSQRAVLLALKSNKRLKDFRGKDN
nr:EF-hand calcium-binding domain-containing protein 13 [Mus musculus]